jgi:hypothetical protein
VIAHKSASVGHVCIVHRVDDPEYIFVIKIIKPLAIAQSCWEFKTLYDVFPKDICQSNFVRNILESNGRELNVDNERDNLITGYKCYNADYGVFDARIKAKLSTVQYIENAMKPGCWFALAMTLAPGVPISDLIESDSIKTDTRYRAKLHRCFDLLVYKFFYNLVHTGFYHGDLHSGNIFFSYQHNQMTLIDFGAVGQLNIYENSPDTKIILDIIIMSLFYNFDGILHKLTAFINSKCENSKSIDMESVEYKKFAEQLRGYHWLGIANYATDDANKQKYSAEIFSDTRIKAENEMVDSVPLPDKLTVSSIYSYLEYKPAPKEVVVEERDVLPPTVDVVAENENTSLNKVLEMIIKFYAMQGVNIIIKFSELYEFQKAYALLLGVLAKVSYNSYRVSIVIQKAIRNWRVIIKSLTHPHTATHAIEVYRKEKAEYNAINAVINKSG